jgi:hypothetical protein
MQKSGEAALPQKSIRLCARVSQGKECVYLAVQKMIKRMKEDIARVQAIPYPEQIVVAKIYDIVLRLMAEACRRSFDVDRQDCDPSVGHDTGSANLDMFILLNQLKEDGYITEEYKSELFLALSNLSPQIRELVKSDAARGLL